MNRGLVFAIDAIVALTLAASLTYAIFHAVNIGEPTSWQSYRAYRLGEAVLTVFEKSGLLERASSTMDDSAKDALFSGLGQALPQNFAARIVIATDSASIEVTHPYAEHLRDWEDTYISRKMILYQDGGVLRQANVTLQLWGLHKSEWSE